MAALLSFFAFYVFGPAKYQYHSDTTDSLMWAHASWDAKALIHADFRYAVVLLLNGHLLMAPFVGMFGFGMIAQQAGMFSFIVLFAVALFWLFRTLRWERLQAALGTCGVLLSLLASEKSREIFFDHVFTYNFSMLMLTLCFVVLLKCLRAAKQNSKHFPILLLATGFLFLGGGLNRTESLTLFIFPLLAGVVGERLLRDQAFGDSGEKNRFFVVVGVALSGSLLGILAASLITAGMSAGYQAAYSAFTSSDKWVGQAQLLLPHWMTFLGVTPEAGLAMSSGDGILMLLRIVLNTLFAAVPVILLVQWKKWKNASVRVLLLAHWLMSALILIGFIFGRLSAASWRLSPIAYTSIILTIVWIHSLLSSRATKRFAVLLAIPLALSCMIHVAGVFGMRPEMYPIWQNRQNLEAFMRDEGLSYGYASFWNANIITMETNSDIKVRNVIIDDEGIRPYLYQTRDSWYENQPGQEEYFILLTESEYGVIIKHNAALLDAAIRDLTFENYKILIFPQNIFPNNE